MHHVDVQNLDGLKSTDHVLVLTSNFWGVTGVIGASGAGEVITDSSCIEIEDGVTAVF